MAKRGVKKNFYPLAERKRRARIVLEELGKLFPDAKIALNFSNPWELLVAVMLSAQCTDKQVNIVTAKLFKKYPKLGDYLRANPQEFEKDIYSTGFYRTKAKNILAAAKIINEKHGGKIPCTMAELIALPGVARKTANIVLGNVCGAVEGIAVDTHVKRLSGVLRLSGNTDPDKIERDLMEVFPQEEWLSITYRLIEYGRNHCSARRHDHANCPLTKALKERL